MRVLIISLSNHQIRQADKDAIDFQDDLGAMNYFYYEADSDETTPSISAKIAEYVANEVTSLLNSQVVKEQDIAILVESGSQAELIQDALKAKGLLAVYLSQHERVYQSVEAKELLLMMEGLCELENRGALKKLYLLAYLVVRLKSLLITKPMILNFGLMRSRVQELYA